MCYRFTMIAVCSISFAACLFPAAGRATLGQASSSQAASTTLTNNDILHMTKSGLSPDIVVAKIQNSPCSFETSPAALSALKSAGVPDSVILAMVNASGPKAQKQASPSPQAEKPVGAAVPVQQPREEPSKGCLAVKPVGSHALRNIMLLGVAGALISKQQYQVVDAVGYPAQIGQKYHGNDLQTVQSNGTKVVILEKRYTSEELHQACH